jgi:hypothetical protein
VFKKLFLQLYSSRQVPVPKPQNGDRDSAVLDPVFFNTKSDSKKRRKMLHVKEKKNGSALVLMAWNKGNFLDSDPYSYRTRLQEKTCSAFRLIISRMFLCLTPRGIATDPDLPSIFQKPDSDPKNLSVHRFSELKAFFAQPYTNCFAQIRYS